MSVGTFCRNVLSRSDISGVTKSEEMFVTHNCTNVTNLEEVSINEGNRKRELHVTLPLW